MKILLLTILLLSFGQAQANRARSFQTSSDLMKECEAYIELEREVEREANADLSWTNVANAGNCVRYIESVHDTHNAFTSWKWMDKYWCTPAEINADQLIKVVVKSLQKQPEKLHYAASALVAQAFTSAFPCGGES